MTDRALRFLCLLLAGVLSEPTPGRIPKVYNALITSNQNLEPSKAYPVYQPVIHDAAFAYPFQPAVFYGGNFPLSNGIAQVAPPQPPTKSAPAPSAGPAEAPSEKTPEQPADPEPPAEASIPQPDPSNQEATPAPPLPPNTQSPIPLNEFGLPSQVLPLGRFDPAYDGFTQVGPFTYSYPGYRFYDPYDPFSFSPYANLPPPLYRPFTNVLSPGPHLVPPKVAAPSPVSVPAAMPSPSEQAPDAAPPSEPSDLNVLNYSSKDPAIPNVPPPPLPSGGLKGDKSE